MLFDSKPTLCNRIQERTIVWYVVHQEQGKVDVTEQDVLHIPWRKLQGNFIEPFVGHKRGPDQKISLALPNAVLFSKGS